MALTRTPTGISSVGGNVWGRGGERRGEGQRERGRKEGTETAVPILVLMRRHRGGKDAWIKQTPVEPGE